MVWCSLVKNTVLLIGQVKYLVPRKNYGIFNTRFKGPKVWNSISEISKTFSLSKFKESVKSDLVKDY